MPIGIIRCISDLADGGAQEYYAAFKKKAADKAAEIVLKALKKIEKKDTRKRTLVLKYNLW